MSAIKGNSSENEDDPSIYESSGEEWKLDEEKKRNKRRTSQRVCKKLKVELVDLSSDESEDEKPKGRNNVNRKQKGSGRSKKKCNSPTEFDRPTGFKNGSFLISKEDAQSGYKNKLPCIWRIDGKALLQKFEPFVEDGIVKHRSTSIYTGWSVLEKDLYAPISVHNELFSGQKLIVQINFDQLKEINMESD